MAVNRSRNMRAELEEGVTEGTYMKLYPMRGGVVEDTDSDRLSWPTYQRVEQRPDTPAVIEGCGCYHPTEITGAEHI